jgi:hypothetical protein
MARILVQQVKQQKLQVAGAELAPPADVLASAPTPAAEPAAAVPMAPAVTPAMAADAMAPTAMAIPMVLFFFMKMHISVFR